MKIGYGRVSTRDQNPAAQHDALTAADCDQRNSNVRGLPEHDSDDAMRTITWRGAAPGSIHVFKARLEGKRSGPLNVVLNFTCVEAGTGKTWTRTLTAHPTTPIKWGATDSDDRA